MREKSKNDANNLKLLIDVLKKINMNLYRIANALENPAPSSAACYKRNLQESPTFDWSIIGAKVVRTDRSGVAFIRWGGSEYIRRNKQEENGSAERLEHDQVVMGIHRKTSEKPCPFKARRDRSGD